MLAACGESECVEFARECFVDSSLIPCEKKTTGRNEK